jgi:sigma54-dependent transcription regulator
MDFLKCFFSLQIETLKEEIERRQNDHQMKSAHNLILELQTELAEYKDLTDSLQLAEKLQVCIFVGFFEIEKKLNKCNILI